MPIKITKEQCDALIHFPDENITSRKKHALNGLYKKLLKECNELYKTKQSIQTAVMESVKFTLGKVDDIDTRMHNLKVMKIYLSLISPCIVQSNLTPLVLALVKKDKGRFSDVIYFNKQIGTESAFGVAYLNTGVDEGSKLVFSAKITTDDQKVEVALLEKMSQSVQKHETPNFPIIYKILHCKDVKEDKKEKDRDITGINDIIKYNKYYVILNELATGDLNYFIEEKTDTTSIQYESVFFQALLSLRAFHIHTKYIHDDAHGGNFLIHAIKKGGYWHYKYRNTNIYVPNAGYLVVLWDPGLAKKIVPRTEYLPYADYYRFYGFIKHVMNKGFDFPQQLYDHIKLLIAYVVNNLNDENAIMKYLEKKPKFKNILFTLPEKSHIINNKPYYL